MDLFGSTSPEKMPPHFFWHARAIAYDSAIRADVDRQDYTVAPYAVNRDREVDENKS